MISFLVIDMQVGSFEQSESKYEPGDVIARINEIGRAVREANGRVVFVQHDAPPGEEFAPGTPAWELLPELERTPADLVVHKAACDAFYETDLDTRLRALGTTELLVSGSATEYCVDTTVRAAASRDFAVTVVADGHTTSDRTHLDAATIVRHHNEVWRGLILPRSSVQVKETSQVLSRLRAEPPMGRAKS